MTCTVEEYFSAETADRKGNRKLEKKHKAQAQAGMLNFQQYAAIALLIVIFDVWARDTTRIAPGQAKRPDK